MNILLLTPLEDKQSGTYIHDTLIGMGHKVAFFDWRKGIQDIGVERMNEEVINSIKELKPDLTLIIKGMGITGETIRRAREEHDHSIVGWIFDVTIGGTYVKDVPQYIDFIKELDIFYTIDNDAIKELEDLGVNAKWLSEGCYLPAHGEQVINYIQKKKFGAPLVFLGSVGTIHPNREQILSAIFEEGYPLKIYGDVFYPETEDPTWVKDTHTGFSAINDYHSIVVQSSDIVIGIDGWTERDLSYSARLYRTLCAGGFYLTTHTKGIEKYFVPGVHLDTFSNKQELMEKISLYLHDDNKREEIRLAGQKLVLEQHTFEHRLRTIIGDIEK
jgi:spore maturation protein CgeB